MDFCSPPKQKYLLSLNIQYNDCESIMVRKEAVLASSMIVLVVYTLSLSFVSQAYTQGQNSKTLSSSGNIQIQTSEGIGVYQNSLATQPLNSLSWGTLQPGESQGITIYVKTEGSSAVNLSLLTSNWSPANAQTYLALSWNYNNQPINPNEVAQVTLTLNVDPNIEGITNFSFDVTIVSQ